MTESSHPSNSMQGVPFPNRPNPKKSRHTWHSYTKHSSKNHFEDFMREINVDPRVVHLCCVPQQTSGISHHHSKKGKGKLVEIPPNNQAVTLDLPSKQYRDRASSIAVARHRQLITPPGKTTSARNLARLTVGSVNSKIKPSLNLKTQATFAISTAHEPPTRAAYLVPRTARESLLSSIAGDKASIESSSRNNDLQISHHPEDGACHSHPSPNDTPRRPSLALTTSSFVRSRRTPSFASVTTASSSEGPETPRGNSPLLTPSLELHQPSLGAIEHSSRFRVRTLCATCKKTGSNFPSCQQCGDMWCSRQCRMKAGTGGSHSCGGKQVHYRADSSSTPALGYVRDF